MEGYYVSHISRGLVIINTCQSRFSLPQNPSFDICTGDSTLVLENVPKSKIVVSDKDVILLDLKRHG